MIIFFFKQKTAYEMRISDWSSDVCSSDLTTRSVGLTNDGASFFEHCLQILGQIEDAENLLGQATSSPHGRLRVHLPVGFGRRVIMPMVPRFLKQHPDLDRKSTRLNSSH